GEVTELPEPVEGRAVAAPGAVRDPGCRTPAREAALRRHADLQPIPDADLISRAEGQPHHAKPSDRHRRARVRHSSGATAVRASGAARTAARNPAAARASGAAAARSRTAARGGRCTSSCVRTAGFARAGAPGPAAARLGGTRVTGESPASVPAIGEPTLAALADRRGSIGAAAAAARRGLRPRIPEEVGGLFRAGGEHDPECQRQGALPPCAPARRTRRNHAADYARERVARGSEARWELPSRASPI